MRDARARTCNESVCSPQLKAISRKLSSAWPEAIVIGSRVATHVLSAIRGRGVASRRRKPGTDQSSGLGVTNATTAATCLWSRPFLNSISLSKSKWDTGPLPTQACILSHHHTAKRVEKSKQEPAEIRESSRNFREKIPGKHRDPLHARRCGSCVAYGDVNVVGLNNTAKIESRMRCL